MNKYLVKTLLAAAAVLAAPFALAHGPQVSWSVSVGSSYPGPVVYNMPPPVVYMPPQPVYVQPPPPTVYVAPQPVYYYGPSYYASGRPMHHHRHGKHHHRFND